MIKIANERLAKISNVKFIQSNICDIELQDKIDIVFFENSCPDFLVSDINYENNLNTSYYLYTVLLKVLFRQLISVCMQSISLFNNKYYL